MVELTILTDNREKKPWLFTDMAETESVTLETGDYTIAELCDYDEESDVYYPEYAIERKSGDDFTLSISSDRDRFEKEIRRASDWESPLLVLIESTKSPSRYSNSHFMDYTNLTRDQIFGTVDSWEKHYNVSFRFAGSRMQAQKIAFNKLLSELRSHLM